MSGMKVLQFITPNGFYGAERWVWALSNNLDSEGVICELAVTRENLNQDLTVADDYPGNGQVHYMDMSSNFDVGVVGRLAGLLRDRNIDVIHTHGYKSDIIGWLAARRAGVRCISTPHGYPARAGLKMGFYIQAGLIALRRFDRIAPLSRQLMTDMQQFAIPLERVRLIENGVDMTELDPWRLDLHNQTTKSEPFHIGYIGQLISRKGIDDLLQVFEQVCRNHPGCRLTLIGDGSQRVELEAKAASIRCHGEIRFLGFRRDRLAQLAEFDAFLMTSYLEGIPRCLMEAMTVGVPVVAYDIEGVNQLVQHERTGLVAALGDLKGLAEQLMRLVENPSLGRKLAREARRHVDEHFSARRMAEEYEKLYRDMIVDILPKASSFK